MAQQPLMGKAILFFEASGSHLLGLLWTSDQPDTETFTWQQTTLTRGGHPRPLRDSNPQFGRAQTHTLDRADSDLYQIETKF
jgi:hypothetical protein